MATKKIILTNRQAQRDYFILESFEAGIELKGNEIKSIRQRKANLKDSFAKIEKSEIFLHNLHISPYKFARSDEVDPKRPRKLLLRKKEIRYLNSKISEKGLTLIPLNIHFKRKFAKVELGLAKGKKVYDKRESIRKKVAQREIDRVMKGR